MQSQSKTLCVAPLPCSGAGNVQFGFSLRLFNSSHIFFIDFSTPAFLWSIRSSSLWWKLFVVVCCRCCCYFGQNIKLISLRERAFTLSPCHKIYVYVVKFSSIFRLLWAPLLLHAFWFHCLSLRRTKVQVSCSLSVYLRPHQVYVAKGFGNLHRQRGVYATCHRVAENKKRERGEKKEVVARWYKQTTDICFYYTPFWGQETFHFAQGVARGGSDRGS